MAEESIALVRRWFEETWNQRRGDLIDELILPEGVCHADEGDLRGPDEFRERQYAPFLAAFPDLRVEVEGVLGCGDEVVVRWSATGTHRGDDLGCRATHRPVTFRGITWIRVRDGRLDEGWQSSNIPEVIRSLATS